jgi:histidinol phosphatase-like enzyme (inositol monophosphatase family)
LENLKEFKLFAKHLSEISGAVIKSYFRTELKIDSKSDSSPVTIADKKAEELMRETIIKEFPDHGIVGEEFGTYNETSEYKWVLDPIDGTKSFICGTVTFGTLIALSHKGEPVLGVINQPVLKEHLIGDNKSAQLNDVNVKVRNVKNLANAVLLTTDHLNIGKYHNQKKFDNLIKKVKLYRNWGDCYGYYLVATGFADIMIDPVMNVWDSMALIPVIQGAGGVITDYKGGNPLSSNSIVASTSIIHNEVIKSLN